MSKERLIHKSDSIFYFRFLFFLLSCAMLAVVLIYPVIASADAEAQNLRSFTLRQFDFLIKRINKSETFDAPAQKVVDKISENLETLSSHLVGSIKKREFQEVSDRLYAAVEDWESGQLVDAKVGLLKAKVLLGSFGF